MYYIEKKQDRLWVRIGGNFQFKFDAEAKIAQYMTSSSLVKGSQYCVKHS